MTTTDVQTVCTVLERLDELARDIDHEASLVDGFDAADTLGRAAASLRLIRTGLREGTFDALEGYSWLHMGRAFLRAASYARAHGVSYDAAVAALDEANR